ncbi:hypothetical protein JG688_00003097 [Phytophthora aleatoria]|uniref:Transmembrane protein n=1 Tax=Phytophthora aleatoria TaxID=2496075 RepID=A0A8J5ITT2_9STRA|nr:hypothetical protein JG688_00003097 [Phytophthora aleatoria]
MSNAKELKNESDLTTALTDEVSHSTYSLHVRVQRLRVVAGSLVMACVLLGAILPFAHNGARVGSTKTPSGQVQLDLWQFDRTTHETGIQCSSQKPEQVYRSSSNCRRGLSTEYWTECAQHASDPGQIHPTILASDLIVENDHEVSQPLDGDNLLTTTFNAKYRENTPGNSVLNTIMRTLLIPTEEIPTWCNRTDDYQYPFKNVHASYGFPSRAWQQRALSSALEPTVTLSIPLNTESSELPSDEELPMTVSIATNLAVYALVVSNTFLGWWKSADEV